MWQLILTGILFVLAVFYISRMAYRQFSREEPAGCSKPCGKTSSKNQIDKA